ncbi:tetratricopeptide repeat protein [Streptomyces sp. NPDC005065]|uniref:tetratricopeptide repeat protein n=1 Tax=Streptomyces sp. NPDC005065 TaxID=3154461 RepID=UPI0033A92C89
MARAAAMASRTLRELAAEPRSPPFDSPERLITASQELRMSRVPDDERPTSASARHRALCHGATYMRHLLAQTWQLAQDARDRAGEAEVLNRIGTLRLKCGDPRQAQAHHLRALELARTIRNQLEEARALEGGARCCELTGNYPAALSGLREAVSLYQRIGAAEAPTAARYLAQLEAERPEEGSVQDSTV